MMNHPPSALAVVRHLDFAFQLIRRDISARYRGSTLGLLWSLITPLFLLCLYTFVFGSVFQSKWDGARQNPSQIDYALILFAGLIVFQIFSEVITKSPTLILSNVNYVKKVVFPLELLSVVAVGSALFHGFVSLGILLCFMLAAYGSIPLSALWLPLIWAPYCTLIIGFSWFLASFGVYYRDINQFLASLVTAVMFLSPIFSRFLRCRNGFEPGLCSIQLHCPSNKLEPFLSSETGRSLHP